MTRGEVIAARATAGATCVTLRDSLARIPQKAFLIREVIEKQLQKAEKRFAALQLLEETY